MLPFEASTILVVDGIEQDPVLRARAERLRSGITAGEVRPVTDEELNAVMGEVMPSRPLHGMHSDIKPVVVFNRFRFEDSEDERERRIEAYPNLRTLKLNGYGGFDWRESGSPAWRKQHGIVCQPAWAIHSIVGCHFRCAYCNLGWFVNIMLNVEDFVERLDAFIEQCPTQRLFQWDNYTDAVCYEPEYGAAKLFIEYFAQRPGQALEFYVGKSDRVDFCLDYDHRGHTVCCWSLSAFTQSAVFEPGSASTEARIESMRKCQQAGYPVRVRLSPIIPVKNWREENRAMLAALFDAVQPDIMTVETIRFLDYHKMAQAFDLDLLDASFVQAMKDVADEDRQHGFELPDAVRQEVYDVILPEIELLSPDTPYAFCRESFAMWDHYESDFARHGQHTDRYLCNCGAHCAPATAGVA